MLCSLRERTTKLGILFLLLFLSHIVLKFRKGSARFIFRKEGFAAGQGIFQALPHQVWINVYGLPVKRSSDIHPNGIADFVFLGCEGGVLASRRWSLLSVRCRSLLRLGVAQQH